MDRRIRRALVGTGAVALMACGGGDLPPEGTEPGVSSGSLPAGPDIWLARLVSGPGGALSVEDPENVTRRPGYDNQPAFLPDGSAFYYTVIDDAGQADIWRYSLGDRAATPVTSTNPESEYSGTPLPDGTGFSAIRVEADSTQRLWRFDPDGGGASVIFPDIAPAGYHVWVDAGTAVLFVLGEPATLQVAHLASGTGGTVARDVGRSIQLIPGTTSVSFVQRRPDGSTEIRRLDPGTGASEPIVAGVEGGDFHAWTPDGVLLQAHEGRLLAFRPGTDADWREVADLSGFGVTLSRLAVHPGGGWVAMVAEPSAAP
jgi:hypothetical protein